MKTIKSKEIIRIIAKEEGLTIPEVEEIISVHFEFVRHVQSKLLDREKNYFPTVRLPNFGMFYIPESTKERLIKVNLKDKDESSRIQE